MKFHTEFFVDEPASLTETRLLNAKQLLELVLEVKIERPGTLSTLEIYLEKNVVSIRNITSSFLELEPYNQRRCTGDFRIEGRDKRLVILDDIQGVQIPQEKSR